MISMSELLVYESKGASRKQINDIKIGIIICLSACVLCAVRFLSVISELMKRWNMSPVSQMLRIVTDEEKHRMIACAFIFMAFAFLIVLMLGRRTSCKNCFVKVYNDYLEAKTFSSVLKIEVSKIDYVQIDRLYLFVTVGGKREKIICENPEKLYSVLNELIKNQG